MSDQQYASVIGFVQFDPEEKTINNGQSLLNFSVRAVGWTGQPLVQVTLWEADYGHVFERIQRGTFVAVDGKYKQNGKYHNLSATKLAFVDEVERAEREDRPAATATADTNPAF